MDISKQGVFSYLNNDMARKVPFTRLNPSQIVIHIPEYPATIIDYDFRDQRTMLIFDGDIPCNGLPRSADQVAVLSQYPMNVSSFHTRTARTFELPHPHTVWEDGSITVTVSRRVLLLPAGKAILLRYRQDSLAVWYCFVKVTHGENGPIIVFQNTDY